MARLAATLRRLGEFRSVGYFLLARLTYNEGFVVLMLFSGVYAATVMHWKAESIVVLGLCNSVAAALAGAFCGWLDNRIGSRRSAIFFVTGSLLATIVVCSTTPDSAFFIRLAHPLAKLGGPFPTTPDRVFAFGQMAVATFVTGGLASSRSLMAQLTPPEMLNEFFGVYSMSGTATSFVRTARHRSRNHVLQKSASRLCRRSDLPGDRTLLALAGQGTCRFIAFNSSQCVAR